MGTLKNFLKKRFKASSINEVIIATTILLLVFSIALVTISNIMMSSIKKDTQTMENKLEKITYQHRYTPFKIPTTYKEDNYTISIEKESYENLTLLVFSIEDARYQKRVQKKQLEDAD